MLEDEFSDIVRKASRGVGIDVATLASRTGLDQSELKAWIGGNGAPTDGEAREIARVLRLDPGKLADSAAQRWEPHVASPEDVRHHPQDPHPSNGYIFFLEDGKTAALIDPAGDPNNLRRAIAEGPYVLRYILITHKHLDHCDATADVAKQFPDAQIVMHKSDVHAIGALASKAIPVRDGEQLPFGDAAAIRMLHTPGHTDGSSCYLFKSTVFTGDTLFAGSIGGAFGENTGYQDILRSVSTKLFKLDEETVVMPGHGPPSTIGLEKQHNPFFNGF
ncbi:MAG: MBL fold metallo-hydrolase [Vulcanimicrobiaceae bacterium]|jgi:glyoxylase-like metal-dependent hydrolase (beta-lactamase superfamily II)